jgi:hypothetical protein
MREDNKLKPSDEVFIKAKARELFIYAVSFQGKIEDLENFLRFMFHEIRGNIDPEEIIQAVLNHVDCHHVTTHDEDGLRDDAEYDVKKGCHEAVRKVLGVEK